MLRAALIGIGSSGKTTLFQLMTSAAGTARGAHGRGETQVGISKVPDARLDRLTAMFNPKKRVPATIEFTDLVATGAGGAKALVDVAAYKNADALVHVLRSTLDARSLVVLLRSTALLASGSSESNVFAVMIRTA